MGKKVLVPDIKSDVAARDAGDDYSSGAYRWWHLSTPSSELLSSLASGWLPRSGRVIDIGCGLGTDIGHLARSGRACVGVDVSETAVRKARRLHREGDFARATALRLPFRDRSFSLALDRGCFHYLHPKARASYESEIARVLEPEGRLFLRACLTSEGRRNDIDEEVVRRTFPGWKLAHTRREDLRSDTRMLSALVTVLEPPPWTG